MKGATSGQGQTMLETIARVRPTLYQRSAFWHSPAVCSLPAAAHQRVESAVMVMPQLTALASRDGPPPGSWPRYALGTSRALLRA